MARPGVVMNSTSADEVSTQALSPRSSWRGGVDSAGASAEAGAGSTATGFSPLISLVSCAIASGIELNSDKSTSGISKPIRNSSLKLFDFRLIVASLSRRTFEETQLPGQ